MAEVTGGILKNVEGHLDDMTIYKRGGKTFMRPTHIRQHLLSRICATKVKKNHNDQIIRNFFSFDDKVKADGKRTIL